MYFWSLCLTECWCLLIFDGRAVERMQTVEVALTLWSRKMSPCLFHLGELVAEESFICFFEFNQTRLSDKHIEILTIDFLFLPRCEAVGIERCIQFANADGAQGLTRVNVPPRGELDWFFWGSEMRTNPVFFSEYSINHLWVRIGELEDFRGEVTG